MRRPPSHPELAIVAAKVPQGVICLISALAFHELTTQIPHAVYLAIPRNAEPPRIDYPPVRSFRFSGEAFTAGIETHDVGPVSVRIYCREKTLADSFKFRNKIGLDTCVEALRAYGAKPLCARWKLAQREKNPRFRFIQAHQSHGGQVLLVQVAR